MTMPALVFLMPMPSSGAIAGFSVWELLRAVVGSDQSLSKQSQFNHLTPTTTQTRSKMQHAIVATLTKAVQDGRI